MDPDRCPACARTFTPGEVTGLGFLRSRPASAGGPFLEFHCPGCDRRIRLIPHGDGRYAPPGQPPPPAASASDRRPPWVVEGATRTPGRSEPPTAAPPPPPPKAPPRPVDSPLARARAVLGIDAQASAEHIEEVFRKRSLTCHPDKVAHLDHEFQTLAERKFVELKAAYDLLRDPDVQH